MMLLAALCLLLMPIAAQAQAGAQQAINSPPSTAPGPAPASDPRSSAKPAVRDADAAALARQDAEMTRAALQAAQLIDANRSGELWDGASSVARNAVTREAFVNQIAAERSKAGALVGRGKPSVSRMRYAAGGPVPEGVYVNVAFPTRFANSPQPVRELVSFRLEEDKVLRLAGYALTPPAASPSR